MFTSQRLMAGPHLRRPIGLLLALAIVWAAPAGSLPSTEAPAAVRPGPRGACCGFRAESAPARVQLLRVRGGATSEPIACSAADGDDAGVEGGRLHDGDGDEWLDEYFPEEQRKEWYAAQAALARASVRQPSTHEKLCAVRLRTCRGWAAVRLGGVYLTFVLTPIPIVGCFMNRFLHAAPPLAATE